jgi:hypothetical protein
VQRQPAVGQAMRKDAVDRASGAQQIALRYLGAQCFGPEPVRRKIDHDGVAGLPVRRDLQYRRAAEAAVGKEKLFPKAPQPGGGDDLGRNLPPDRRSGVRSSGAKVSGTSAGRQGCSRKPNCCATLVAKRSSAHLRNGQAPGGDDQGAPGENAAVGLEMETVVVGNFRTARVGMDRDPGGGALLLQHGNNVAGRAVAKELAQRLLVPGNLVLLHQLEEIGRGVAGKRGLGKMRIRREEVFSGGVQVGEVAAASTGDQDLLADPAACSSNRTRRPPRPAWMAQKRPAAPAPTIKTSPYRLAWQRRFSI